MLSPAGIFGLTARLFHLRVAFVNNPGLDKLKSMPNSRT